MRIVEIKGNNDDAVWDSYVHARPAATGYHLTAWRQILEESFGHKTIYLSAKDERGEIKGVLPLILLDSRPFGRFLVSMPFLNYGGVVADDPEAFASLLASAANAGRKVKASHIELRHQEAASDIGLPVKQHKVSMRLQLPDRFEMLWKEFPTELRTKIRRAEKEGMTVRTGGQELLEDFYRVFSRNMRDLGTPVYGQDFFKKILQAFPKDARICSVHLKGRPLAAGFLYGFRNGLEIPWASSDRRYNHLRANMLLYSSVLEYACRQGFRVFDFGRSTPDSGTYRFKEQWGAKPVPLYWYYWLASGESMPDISPRNPKYELAIKLWRRLPISATKLIGPMIAKNLP